MKGQLKLIALKLLKTAGVFEVVAGSNWRRDRLLILCYHGISLEDEHLWRPALYMQPQQLEQRFQLLKEMKCSVLPLGDALARLQSRTLPPRSVAITFDDGTYDFYKQAFPLLKRYGFPAIVYQTTYYTDHEMPLFNLICSYMLWHRRGEQLAPAADLGLTETMDLRSEAGRHKVVRSLIDRSDQQNLTGAQRNELARRLAAVVGIDYDALCAKRILQLMNPRELAEVAQNGVDVQLHTHRHRTPLEETLFRREIAENRDRIRTLTGKEAAHFCYPSGVYRPEYAHWLEREGIFSATTCDVGLVDRDMNRYLLPRFIDTSGRTPLEFAAWLSGVGSLLSFRKAAAQKYVPAEG